MSDYWETPKELFCKLNLEFGFTLDPCCTIETAKCDKYFTEKENGIFESWEGERVYMNPPYSEIDTWVNKARLEVLHNNCPLVVALLPAWTDRIWFHEHIYPDKAEIRFLKGRINFLLNGEKYTSPTWGSMVVIFK